MVLARANSSVNIITLYSNTCKMRPIMYLSLKVVMAI